MVRMCICCKYRVNKCKSDVSLYAFPKDNVIRKKWLQLIRTEKICESARICSRHFKEDDFRYSLIGGKRFLKQGAIPSLLLNTKVIDNNQSSNNEDEDTENNQVTENTNERIVQIIDSQSLSTVELQGEKDKKDNESQQIIEEFVCETSEQTGTEDICTKNPQFVSHDNLQVPKIISSSPCQRGPERKRKRCLYDVRWEEISTSPAQAKIYWEVTIGKIMRQRVVIKTLRQRVRRLKGKILELRTLVRNITKNGY